MAVTFTVFFFFPGDKFRVSHSLKFEKIVFFSKKVGKNKTSVFLFFRGIVYELLAQFFLSRFIFTKKKIMFGLFLFPPTFGRIFLLFSLEKFKRHSLTHLQRLFFSSGHGKQKKQFFYSLSRISPKYPKNQTFPQKKNPVLLTK